MMMRMMTTMTTTSSFKFLNYGSRTIFRLIQKKLMVVSTNEKLEIFNPSPIGLHSCTISSRLQNEVPLVNGCKWLLKSSRMKSSDDILDSALIKEDEN